MGLLFHSIAQFVLLSSEQLLWACTHHLDAQGAILGVVPRWEDRSWLGFRATCLHSSLHLCATACAWEISLSPYASLGWTVLPAGIWARQHLWARLQFQQVPVGATTIQTIINHWPTPPRLSLKPNTIKKPPQGPNLPGCVNDFLVKVVEPPSPGIFKAHCRKQEQSVWWGVSVCWQKDQIKRTSLFRSACPAEITMSEGTMT